MTPNLRVENLFADVSRESLADAELTEDDVQKVFRLYPSSDPAKMVAGLPKQFTTQLYRQLTGVARSIKRIDTSLQQFPMPRTRNKDAVDLFIRAGDLGLDHFDQITHAILAFDRYPARSKIP